MRALVIGYFSTVGDIEVLRQIERLEAVYASEHRKR